MSVFFSIKLTKVGAERKEIKRTIKILAIDFMLQN
jgi:hypothetical protein